MKPGGGRTIQERHQLVVVPGDIQQAARLALQAHLRPAPGFEQLVQRADAARQRQEGVGQFPHADLALGERADDVECREAVVTDLALVQEPRDHADHATTRTQRRVRNGSHQADVGAAVYQRPAAAGDLPPHVTGGRHEARIVAGGRAAEDADRGHACNERMNAAGSSRRSSTSTSAEPTTTPSTCPFMRATCSWLRMPKPAQTGTGDTARTRSM